MTILIRQRRGCIELETIELENNRFISASIWLFLGWALHYFPFYGMGRILYFHHYFPAAIYSSMLSAVIIDYLLKVVPIMLIQIVPSFRLSNEQTDKQHQQMARFIFHLFYGLLMATLIYSFYLFSPLAYGIVRLPTSSSLDNTSTNQSSFSISNNHSTTQNQPDYDQQSSTSIGSSNEQSMQSLRWMESWEF